MKYIVFYTTILFKYYTKHHQHQSTPKQELLIWSKAGKWDK